MGFKHGERARLRRFTETAMKQAAKEVSAEIQTETTPIETRVTTLEGSATSLDGRLDVVEPALTTAQADITSLDGRLDTAETDITNLEAADVALDGRLDAEEVATTSMDGRLDTIEAALPNKLQWVAAPAAANSAGTAGQIAYASGFIYVAVGADEWQRVAMATWV